jgi:hypothetical protein
VSEGILLSDHQHAYPAYPGPASSPYTSMRQEETELTILDNAMPPRSLGLVVLRGPNVVLISPTDGSAGESRRVPFPSLLSVLYAFLHV